MKRFSIIFLLFYCTFIQATEQELEIYLCSRLTKEALEWNNFVTKYIEDDFVLFRPQDVILDHLKGNELDYAAYKADFAGIEKSDLLLVLPPYGRDCAWEIGWYCGNNKPTIAYVEAPGDWMRDAMVKGGLTAIVTNNETLFIKLKEDPSFANKVFFISDRKDLGTCIKQIYYSTVSN